MSENVVEFVPLLGFENEYEILNVEPFSIRRKDNHYVISESIAGKGYIRVNINKKDYLKHRLIALQFLPNDDPEHKTQVDHINHQRDDNRLINLRWVDNSTNQKNRSSTKGFNYTFVNDIDEDSIVVDEYNRHQFEEYYYDETVDKFYFWNGIQYRELKICEDKKGAKFVSMLSIENKWIQIYYSKFKRLYGLK